MRAKLVPAGNGENSVGDEVWVQVRLVPWFGDLVSPGQGKTVVLSEQVGAGSTLRTLLGRLAERYAGFQEAVYSPATGILGEGVVAVRNGSLVGSKALDVVLENADVISLVPPYVGG